VEERGSPALPAELAEALRGPHSRVRWAVRAAFALHGQRALEWLNEAPLRLVDDLLRLTARPSDPRTAALLLLGLEPGASLAAIKRAYRRLAKAHHPDLGGDVEAFHRLDAAYRLLIGSEAQV
jgi:HEAT repeat protein